MHITLMLVALAVAVLAVTAIADRFKAPAPLVLIVGGVAVSYIPAFPEVQLEPDVVLFGLLPPLLYATAISTSLVDFNANRRVILLLSVGLVVATVGGVGVVVHALLPGATWAASFAIGAVVAPPDAVAATAVARTIGLPRRIVTILEGESLLNDATALVSLRTAILALAGGVEAWHVGLDFLRAAGGGVLIGIAGYLLVGYVRKHVTDPVFDTGLSLIVPFAAYVAAEKVEASGVLAVVIAGLLLGHRAPVLQSAQSRIAERMNWRTIAFLLENAVFLLIGLQARQLIAAVGKSELAWSRIVLICGATLVTVIVVRMVWVFVTRYLLIRPTPDPDLGRTPPWTYTFILGWSGMRGVVTLAAAYLLPLDTTHREILLLVAFSVVAGTLFVQGMTLPLVARWLKVPSPDPLDDALARATLLQQASKAGFAALEKLEYDDPHGIIETVRERVDQRNFSAWERLSTNIGDEAPSELYSRARFAMIEAERARVLEIRSGGTVPADVVADVLQMLDVEESMLDVVEEDRVRIGAVNQQRRPAGELCADLERYDAVDTSGRTECPDCVREGTRWVALRQCLACGHVGCCDSSPAQHATRHFHETGHPVMESAEPGEDWRWCYVHHLTA
ncbi:Na+/H+ antiporter [Nocardioides sp. Kera G14]|uniref:Na+/H+ antiporter n=1 Tax=Nocardioides sp. Kera G14 TaxID=2884264 RepID=UPI001D11ED48|nr:Na+/H+ antiporter [Nocardioides sp. Kera G14]UDY23643.1 Na+/H+ antiporter [Nocardioides sp. Kera G14]